MAFHRYVQSCQRGKEGCKELRAEDRTAENTRKEESKEGRARGRRSCWSNWSHGSHEKRSFQNEGVAGHSKHCERPKNLDLAIKNSSGDLSE